MDRSVLMLLENLSYPRDVRVRNEAEALARAGWSVTVAAPRASGEPRRELVRGVAVVRFRMPVEGEGLPGLLLEYLVANVQLHLLGLRHLARGVRVLHLHNPPDTLAGLGLVARALGRRVVFDHHDLVPELFRVRFGGGPLLAAARLLERATFAVATLVLAANESHREVALGRGRVDPARVRVVRNGPRRATFAARVELRPGALRDPHLVYVGAMGPQDGVEALADLLARLRRDHGLAGARLTLVGGGPSRRALEAELRRLGLQDAATFTGTVPHAAVPGLLARADVCVDPAPGTELNHRSTMIKVAEYMAAGRPVAAYRLLETERTADGSALLAECGDAPAFAAAVARLAGDPELRERLALRARERAEALAWERSEEALLAAYEGLSSAPIRSGASR